MEYLYLKKDMIFFSKIIKSNLGKIAIKSLVISIFIISVLTLNFKGIRTLFPVPEIGKDKLIGFAHYYGYPLYYDTIFFFILIFIPILNFSVIYWLSKSK